MPKCSWWSVAQLLRLSAPFQQLLTVSDNLFIFTRRLEMDNTANAIQNFVPEHFWNCIGTAVRFAFALHTNRRTVVWYKPWLIASQKGFYLVVSRWVQCDWISYVCRSERMEVYESLEGRAFAAHANFVGEIYGENTLLNFALNAKAAYTPTIWIYTR